MNLMTPIINFLFVCFNLSIAQKNNSELVNSQIYLALNLPTKKIIGSCKPQKIKCSSLNHPKIVTYGDESSHTLISSILLCMKQQCSELPKKANEEAKKLRSLSLKELKSILIAAGLKTDSLALAKRIKNSPLPQTLSCSSNLQTRYAIYDSCSLGFYQCETVQTCSE